MVIKNNFLRHPSKEDVFTASIMGDDLSLLGFMTLRIAAENCYHISTSINEEKVCILIEGEVSFESSDEVKVMYRHHPITDLPCGVYLPPNCRIKIEGIGNKIGLCAVATAHINSNIIHSEMDFTPNVKWIAQESIEVFERGAGSFTRTIRNIINYKFPSQSLICGETINPPGNWSSFPPHKHDTNLEGKESAHEEVYLHIFKPSQGWGYQEIYSPKHNIQEVFRIENGDVVLIPFGYHPVTCAPGYTLCYFWVLAGATRKLEIADDPAHMWITDSIN